MFYSATCPSDVNPGCARSRAAKDHKVFVRKILGTSHVDEFFLRMLDSSGHEICRMVATDEHEVEVVVPRGTASIVIGKSR